MSNNFITNTGLTQTIVHNNNETHFNELTWDADYDGNTANISVMKNSDGKKENFDITMDNDDLAKLLNVPSIGLPLDKRLEMDFENDALRKEPTYYTVELSNKLPDKIHKPKTEERPPQFVPFTKSSKYLSSPLTNEEFIIPNLRKGKSFSKYTLLKKSKYHKRKKPTHITYKVYKKDKTNSTQNNKHKRGKLTLRRHGKI
jgi:hypothetical protein